MIIGKQKMKAGLVMLVGSATKRLAELILAAAEQLENDGFAQITTVDALLEGSVAADRILLIECGYTESCMGVLQANQVHIDHHLILKDLGLEEEDELCADNVELVKDGMIAECVIIDSQTPKFNCPCCG